MTLKHEEREIFDASLLTKHFGPSGVWFQRDAALKASNILH